MTNTLSRRYVLIYTFSFKLLGFEQLKDMYATDSDFCNIYTAREHDAFDKFYRHGRFLFCGRQLCVPTCSLRELLVRESHSGGLMGHFGMHKTLDILTEHFYWPNMRRDVEKLCSSRIAYR